MKKRGAIGLQFNWIFVLIVGALIIGFFVVVIKNQMEAEDYSTQINVQTKLNSIMQLAIQNPGSLFEVTVKDTELMYDDCNEGFYMNDNRNLRIELEAAFAPDLIKSDRNQILLWTLAWNVPFKATNMMYVTNKDIKYVIVDDDDNDDYSIANEIYESRQYISLPEDITKELMYPTDVGESFDIDDQNNYKVRVVFFNDNCPPSVNTTNPNYDISAVCLNVDYGSTTGVEDQGGLDGWGEVIYFDDETGDREPATHFLGRPSLIGAIFAENREQFDCVMKKAYSRLALVSEVNLERTSALDEYYGSNYPNDACYTSGVFTSGAYEIAGLRSVAGDTSTGSIKAEELYETGYSLKNINHQAELKSCPTIY